ncbi:hypothetical protein FE633_04635 [Streptomyces montanus]|uniref:Uncharacterized protein n=1 Tax=Streptomyces montanus TaxID=2580423 RepID=A0A5R9FZG8_9ACTN|nr:hypothetical protein [Streptomyces montanus]TLS47320.1 hypothetical protein FE633_04635 [Streptomyces montanus]
MTDATKMTKAYEDDPDRGLRSVEEAVRAVQRAFDEIERCNERIRPRTGVRPEGGRRTRRPAAPPR